MSNDQQSPHAKWRNDVIATSEKQAKAIEKAAADAAEAKTDAKTSTSTSKTSDKS